ncbi:MAG: hypothetical protein NVSMB27_44160 [Ktedonobacteraceae bacterium]
MDTLPFLEEVERRIHVCSGVCSHGELGDIANVSKLDIQRPFNRYWWVIGPMNHSVPQRNRNVNPFMRHHLRTFVYCMFDLLTLGFYCFSQL